MGRQTKVQGGEDPSGVLADTGQVEWPEWRVRLVGGLVAFHLAALGAGAVGSEPTSLVFRRVAGFFGPYFDVLDLGYSYRFYVDPPPTPVALATLDYGDGRPAETVRVPALAVPGPPLRRQRQLALAHALAVDARQAKEVTGDSSQSLLARSYARHLCRLHPGCRRVTWRITQHLIPDRRDVIEALESASAGRFDLNDPALFATPEWVGDYECDGS